MEHTIKEIQEEKSIPQNISTDKPLFQTWLSVPVLLKIKKVLRPKCDL